MRSNAKLLPNSFSKNVATAIEIEHIVRVIIANLISDIRENSEDLKFDQFIENII
jgi:hypothetical protein